MKDHFTMERDTDSGLPVSWPECLDDKQLRQAATLGNVGIMERARARLNAYNTNRKLAESRFLAHTGAKNQAAYSRQQANLSEQLLKDLQSIFSDRVDK